MWTTTMATEATNSVVDAQARWSAARLAARDHEFEFGPRFDAKYAVASMAVADGLSLAEVISSVTRDVLRRTRGPEWVETSLMKSSVVEDAVEDAVDGDARDELRLVLRRGPTSRVPATGHDMTGHDVASLLMTVQVLVRLRQPSSSSTDEDDGGVASRTSVAKAVGNALVSSATSVLDVMGALRRGSVASAYVGGERASSRSRSPTERLCALRTNKSCTEVQLTLNSIELAGIVLQANDDERAVDAELRDRVAAAFRLVCPNATRCGVTQRHVEFEDNDAKALLDVVWRGTSLAPTVELRCREWLPKDILLQEGSELGVLWNRFGIIVAVMFLQGPPDDHDTRDDDSDDSDDPEPTMKIASSVAVTSIVARECVTGRASRRELVSLTRVGARICDEAAATAAASKTKSKTKSKDRRRPFSVAVGRQVRHSSETAEDACAASLTMPCDSAVFSDFDVDASASDVVLCP